MKGTTYNYNNSLTLFFVISTNLTVAYIISYASTPL